MRGKKPIEHGFVEALKAAQRNSHKRHWRTLTLKFLFEKLEEEVDELNQAVLDCNPQRILEELGDVLWTAIMIVDHDAIFEFKGESVAHWKRKIDMTRELDPERESISLADRADEVSKKFAEEGLLGESEELQRLVGQLKEYAAMGDPDVWDVAMHRIYDWCDFNRVWLETG